MIWMGTTTRGWYKAPFYQMALEASILKEAPTHFLFAKNDKSVRHLKTTKHQPKLEADICTTTT